MKNRKVVVEMKLEYDKMPLWQLYFLVEQNKIFSVIDPSLLQNYDEKEIYTRIKNEYLKEKGQQLDINSENDKNILYEWIKEKTRYELLNYVIISVIKIFSYSVDNNGNMIKYTDPFVEKNIIPLINLVEKYLPNILENLSDQEFGLSSVSEEECQKLIKEYLVEVDSSLEWLTLYEDTIKNNKIIYLDKYSSEEQKQLLSKLGLSYSSNFCTRIDGEPVIFITRNFTLEDVSTIIHEFVHYVSFNKDKSIYLPIILKETFTIFYELYALLYLEEKGYNKEELKLIKSNRLQNTLMLLINSNSLIRYIKIYLNNGIITEEEDIEDYRKNHENSLKSLDEKMIEEIKNRIPEYFDYIKNYKENAIQGCDKVINEMILDPHNFHKNCIYILGNYLSEQAIKEINNGRNDVLEKMKYYTQNLGDIDVYNIFEFLGCDCKKIGFVPLLEEEKMTKNEKNTIKKLNKMKP